MRKLLKYLYLLSGLAAVSACEIPFALDNISEPRLYVEFMPCSSGRTVLTVAKADPAFEAPSALYEVQEDEVLVSCNGQRINAVKAGETGNFNYFELPAGAFSEGDEVELRVSGRGVQEVSGRTVIPPAPVLSSVEIKAVEGDTTGVSRISFKLPSPAQEGEYYGLQIMVREVSAVATLSDNPLMPIVKIDTLTSFSYTRPVQVATTSDINSLDLDAFASMDYWGPGLREPEEEAPMTLLGSRQFGADGEYSFYLNFSGLSGWRDRMPEDMPEDGSQGNRPDWWPDGIDFPSDDPEDDGPKTMVLDSESWYLVLLYRLTDELYNWGKAQYLMEFNMLSNFGVTPPNFTYTNVSGGLGIVGGISGTSSPWLPDPGNTGRFPEAH